MAWNLYDDDERPSREEIKRDKARDHNRRQKSMMKIIGENLASYACVMIFMLLIGFIWTDIGILTDPWSFLTESLITVVLFVLADICAAQIGTKGGKLDDDYIRVHKEFLGLREEVRRAGIALMDMFCAWQIDVEFEYYVRKRCKDLKIEYETYCDVYEGKSLEELKSMIPPKKIKTALALDMLNHTKQIELTPDMLMTDGKARSERGGVPMSGEEYVEKHTTGMSHVIVTALFAIVAAIPVFTLTKDVSVGRLIYTIFKLAMMSYRMYRGYNRGSKGYNTIELKHLQAKIKYLYLYLEFVKNKIYLKLGDKYGDPSSYTGKAHEEGAETREETATEAPAEDVQK